MREIGIRVMTEIVNPFSRLKLDEAEFACLKAIVFFDPNSKGLKEVERIAKLRRQIQGGVQVDFTLRYCLKDVLA